MLCPTNPACTGSIDCPIFRGSLAVNPHTGDTFAWTVDLNNQDQGLWQDQCALRGASAPTRPSLLRSHGTQRALETSTLDGRGHHRQRRLHPGAGGRALSEQDTLLFAGANDLWKCSLAMGCAWRNTTNATTCMSAQVAALPARAGLERGQSAGDLSGQRQRALALHWTRG